MEDELEQRKQLLEGVLLRRAGENEWGRDGRHGRGSISAHRLRGAPGMAGELADTAGTGCSVSAHPVRDDYPAGNTGAAAETGDGAEGGTGDHQAGDSETHRGAGTTGWEFERAVFLRTVQASLRYTQGNAGGIRQTGQEANAVSLGDDIGIGGAVGIGLRGISALSRLTDNDSDDPEEQKRKQEAVQAANNVGAVLGLAIGAFSTFTKDNQSLTRTPDDEQSVEEEENFNEFLARMDEEYGYEEQQQMM